MTLPAENIDPERGLYSWVRLFTALGLITIGGSGMYSSIAALKPFAATFDVPRAMAAVPYMSVMVGFGLGGIVMGRASDRLGTMTPIFIGAFYMALGFYLSSKADALWQVALSQGLFVGFLGMSTTFAPLIADASHWFSKRRGMAVGIVVSGSYVAGAIWPPVIQHFYDTVGWRETFELLSIFCIITMLPLACVLYRRAPLSGEAVGSAGGSSAGRPLGMPAGGLQCLLCVAGVGCCVGMATPQVHIIAHASDLGYAAARGAEMLSLMLGFGIISRLVSGWVSDRIGGIKTLLIGATVQCICLGLFMPFDGLMMLYIISALFGLSQGGIVPSYAMIVRTYFPPSDAGWRIGLTLFATMLGMAIGGWMAGELYDLTGSYQASFMASIGFNLVTIATALLLLVRAQRDA
jgi:MFS family permease